MKRHHQQWAISSLLLIFFAFLRTASVSAQTATLRGTVTDAQTGEGLPGANITVTSAVVEMRPTGTAAGAKGEFELKGLAAGTYSITVSYIGYTKEVIDDVTLKAGETKSLKVSLSPTGIQFNPISVTASRREEKVLDAPAAITVLEARDISARSTLTLADHLAYVPGVDVVRSGLNTSNVVVRGFNNIFSGTLLSLTDNRYAHVPSLRLNAYQFIPSTNEDVDRIEIVSGPGSALYGPNSANGVMHMITKGPIGSEGTTVSIAGGERSLFMGTLRHAGSFNNRFGYKISGQYYRGNDWETRDPVEPATITKGRQTTTGRINEGGPIPNSRDFDIEKLAGEVRLDYQFSDDLMAILSGGINRASNIELTGIGAAQAVDWTYSFVQARVLYKDLFVQGFLNSSAAGESFLLRTGDLVEDNSKLMVGQIQHSLSLGDRQNFTYGADALFTRPDTKNTINGRNEDDDDINEFGLYLQSETKLSSNFTFVAAGRFDDHNRIEDPVISPRAALVYKPNPSHNFRVTYNRAFSTPTSNNLFLDILSSADAFRLGALFLPSLGFSPSTDVRAQGVPETGLNFSRSATGLPQFRSPFAPLDPRPDRKSKSVFFDLNDPIFTNVMWSVGRGAVLNAFVPTLQGILASQGVPPAQIATLTQAFLGIVPQTVSGVTNVMRTLNPETKQFTQVENVVDVGRIKPTITQTYEFGYKGLIGDNLLVTLDVYRTKVKDFVGPLIVETPNVFLDATTLSASLGQQFGAALADPANAQISGVLLALDSPALGGNGNGSAVDELTKLFVAGTANNGAAYIPYGTVSPKEAFDPTALILTYRNFGDISLTGVDFSFTYQLNRNWNFGGNYSYVSQNFFGKSSTQPQDIALNAPRNKIGASVQYINSDIGLETQLRLRYVDAFQVNSGVYIGWVDSYMLLDLNAGYEMPFSRRTKVALTVQNVLDEKHREIVGAPELGRLAILRLTQTL